MKNDPFYRKLFNVAVPIAFQSLMLSLVAVADAFMLGSLEQNAMSAVSLATQIQFIQNMMILALVEAFSILGSQYWGKGDKKRLHHVFSLALRLSGLLSALFFVGCVFFGRYLMVIFTNEPILIEYGATYLRTAGWSYLMTGISQIYLSLMKVSEHADTAAKISSAAVVINIVLNAVFIYGLFGLPRMGITGAAIATLAARVLELAASFGMTLRKDYEGISFVDLFSRDRELTGDFLKCFWPVLGAGLLWGVGFTSYSAFMGHLGTDAAGANSVASVVRDVICCACNGLGGGAVIIVGNELGAGKLDVGKAYGDRLVRIAFICGFISTALMLAVTPATLSFVKLTPDAKRYLLQMMVVMSVYMIGRAVNTVIINGIFCAGGDTLFDMYSLAVVMWLVAVPLAFAGTFYLNWPPVVVYACTCLDEVGKIPWVLIHYKKYKWVRDLTR